MDETEAPPGRVDKFNDAIRGVLVLMFSSAFVYAFLALKDVVSVSEFVMALMIALNWWFNRRGDEKKPAAKNGNGHSPTPLPTAPPSA